MNTSLYLGIDVSKGYADFCMLNAGRKVIGKPIQLFDVAEGHEALEQYLDGIFDEYHPEQVYAAVESTGTYENHWLDVLYDLRTKIPVKVARLNPLGVSKHRQADMKVQITDKSSSEAIARYLINHADRVEYYNPDSYAPFRACLSHLELLTKQKVQLSNKLHQHLYLCFPEVVRYCRHGLSDSVLELLEHYPTSAAMAKSRQGKCNQIAYFPQSEMQALRERCKPRKDTLTDELMQEIIIDTVKKIKAYDQQITTLFEVLYHKLPKEKLDILTSVPGIGKKTAVTLLCVIGDISRFDNPQQIVGYFGLYPVIKESGDAKKKPHLSRKGNNLLRRNLYLSAMVACCHDPYLRSIYLKSVEKGMSKKSAICKIMKKMLRMLYGMLSHNQHYNPLVDAQYREKFQHQNSNHVSTSDMGERKEEESLIALAPISKKNAHHRKEQTRANVQTRSSGQQLAALSNFLPKT